MSEVWGGGFWLSPLPDIFGFGAAPGSAQDFFLPGVMPGRPRGTAWRLNLGGLVQEKRPSALDQACKRCREGLR